MEISFIAIFLCALFVSNPVVTLQIKQNHRRSLFELSTLYSSVLSSQDLFLLLSKPSTGLFAIPISSSRHRNESFNPATATMPAIFDEVILANGEGSQVSVAPPRRLPTEILIAIADHVSTQTHDG